jgi:threonylcarbamoyladenosine tRNA methylthiotransferase MtaB
MSSDLAAAGLSPAELPAADVVVINSCMVTGPTEAQCRKVIRQARRKNEGATIVVSGCMSEGAGQQLADMPEASMVITPGEKGGLVARLGIDSQGSWQDWPADPAVNMSGRDRPFIKVQDGCDHACSYCIVPSVRGQSRSLAPGKVIRSIKKLMGGRRREVVLTGIHLGLYGRDLQSKTTLEDLLEQLLAEELSGRIRLSSIEPNELSPRLLELIAGSGGRICRHLHIPLQSGSDTILKAMKRPYLADDFVKAVRMAREYITDVGIGCDIICGFPGESEVDYQRSLDLVRDLEIPFLHAFPYSPRPGTAAADLADDVSPQMKKERVRALQEAADLNLERFLDSLVDKILAVIPESAGSGRGGLADNHVRVTITGGKVPPAGEMTPVRVVSREELTLVSEQLEDEDG